MIEFVSWIGVAVIALFAAVGFAGVVATSVLSVVRAVRPHGSLRGVDAREHVRPTA